MDPKEGSPAQKSEQPQRDSNPCPTLRECPGMSSGSDDVVFFLVTRFEASSQSTPYARNVGERMDGGWTRGPF